MAIAGFGHPACTGQVAGMHHAGALRLARWIEAEDDRHDFAPVCALFVRVEQPKVGDEMALVIARDS